MSTHLCRCCMTRPPDKDLKTQYTRLGVSEVYADMLKECFEIHLSLKSNEKENGICEVCIMRLCDANNFKKQVQKCQKSFQEAISSDVKDEEAAPKVKEEIADYDDNGIYFLDLKEEISDYEDLQDPEDDKKLAELLGLNNLTATTVSRAGKSEKKKKPSKSDKKLRKKSSKPYISFHELTKLNKIITPLKKGVTVPRFNFGLDEPTKHKTNIENLMKYSNCTPFCNKTLAGIVCAFCKETYQNPQELRTHIQDKHKTNSILELKRSDRSNLTYKLDITDLKCSICSKNFDVISNLKQHLTKEHDIKFYPDVHDYIFEFKLTDTEMIKCALCHSSYETFKMLLQHMNGHYRNFICDICDVGYINKHKLKNHQRTHEVGNFKCAFCDKEFSTRVRKMCHEKYTHNTTARYTTNCPQCDKSFNSYYQRNRHMFTEHNTVAASYKCNICDKSFILKSKLTCHIKKVHLMERNHICSVCGQGFFIKQSLDEHMIKHNGERVFKCTVCQKAYARKKTLREHMRIHNNDRRFQCGVCGLAFVQKCSMKSHMLSNHGITLAEYENARPRVDVERAESTDNEILVK